MSILPVGSKVLTSISITLEEGYTRLYDYVVLLEEKHMQSLYGVGTNVSKLLIFNKEIIKDRVTLIFVNEKLDF